MGVNEKLKHLTDKQLNEVIEMYLDKTIKVSDILSKYNIDVQPSGLIKILPPIKTSDKCRFCGESLYRRIEARTQYYYDNKNSDKFCLKCGHHEYNNTKWWKKCSCKGCSKRAEIEHEIKRIQIREKYTKNENMLNFDELILEDQVKLIYLLYNNSFHNTFQIAPMGDDNTWIEYLNRMIEIKAISVSSESNIEAFCEEDFPEKYYVGKVVYDVNVNFDEETVLCLNENSYFLEHSDEESMIILLKKYIYKDLIEKFEIMLRNRRLQLHISEEANNRFKELIDKISYTQILELCKRVAIFFSDKVVTGDISRMVAKNAVLSNVSKFYERAIKSDWVLKHAEIENINNELDFFIEKVLNNDVSILKDVACVDNFKKWKKREIDYSQRIRHAKK